MRIVHEFSFHCLHWIRPFYFRVAAPLPTRSASVSSPFHRLSSREPTHFTVPDLRLATRATTERANYRGSDYLANRTEIIARDASEGATFRAKIPLRGRSFLSNRSRYSAIFPIAHRLDLIQVEISISNENRIIILTILKVKSFSFFFFRIFAPNFFSSAVKFIVIFIIKDCLRKEIILKSFEEISNEVIINRMC